MIDHRPACHCLSFVVSARRNGRLRRIPFFFMGYPEQPHVEIALGRLWKVWGLEREDISVRQDRGACLAGQLKGWLSVPHAVPLYTNFFSR